MSFASSPGRLLGRLLLATCALALIPATAAAMPYEQITMDTGMSANLYAASPAAVGDVGHYAGYNRGDFIGDGSILSIGYVRNIQTNTMVDYGGGIYRVYGIDRAEQRVLLGRTRSGQGQIVTVPAGGGAAKILAAFPLTGTANSTEWPSGAMSGDGRKVVLSFRSTGTWRYDVATGARTQLSPLYYGLGPKNISANGATVVGNGEGGTFAAVLSGGPATPISAGEVRLNASGTHVAWDNFSNGVTVRSLKTGIKRHVSTSIPGMNSGAPHVAWLADDGSRVVVVPSPPSGGNGPDAQYAVSIDTATGLASRFGGRFSTSLFEAGSPPWSVSELSPSGTFAITRQLFATQLSLVKLDGTHFTGANEGFAANAYVGNAVAALDCDQSDAYAALIQPAPYAPVAKSAQVNFAVNGQTVGSGTLTTSVPIDTIWFHHLGQTPPPAYSLLQTHLPQGTTLLNITATVVDAQGRMLQTIQPRPVGPFC